MECKGTFDVQKMNPIAMEFMLYILSRVYFHVINLIFVGLEISLDILL